MSLQREDETWTDNEQQTRRVLVDYFKGMYRQRGENMEQLVMLDRLTFLTISGDAQIRLVQIPTALEIFSCLREMSLDKAPGPDGFTVRFLVRE
jgi:hypothetical protein